MKQILPPLYLACILLVVACGSESEKEANRRQLREGLAANKVKRVVPAQIMEGAYELGNEIASATQKSLTKHLQEALTQGNLIGAIAYCNLNALPITDSLSKQYNADIRRVSLQTRNPKNHPDEMERSLLEAYAYTHGQGQALEDNVQRLEEGAYLYNKPIVIKNALCLNCHGVKGQELKEEALLQLEKLYPNDQATGYQMNDLRGMWSIRLERAEIIKELE